MIEFVTLIVVGHVMIGPNLCQTDFLGDDQIYTFTYQCQENGTLQKGSVGMLPSIKYSKQ
jgi:hypothetical protein